MPCSCQTVSPSAAGPTALVQELEQLKAEHELLRTQSLKYEAFIREACAKHGDPLPLGLL